MWRRSSAHAAASDAIEQKEGGLEAVAVEPGVARGTRDAAEGDGERGVEVGAAGGEEVAAGFGEYQPIAEGGSEEARNQNRRIELKLTEK